MPQSARRESLKVARLLMVLSSISPLRGAQARAVKTLARLR